MNRLAEIISLKLRGTDDKNINSPCPQWLWDWSFSMTNCDKDILLKFVSWRVKNFSPAKFEIPTSECIVPVTENSNLHIIKFYLKHRLKTTVTNNWIKIYKNVLNSKNPPTFLLSSHKKKHINCLLDFPGFYSSW